MVKMLEGKELLDNLARYGYPLLRPVSRTSPEEVLLSLARQKDARLLEGFPVVLISALKEKETLEWESQKWSLEKTLPQKERERFTVLLALSCLLFKLFGMEERVQQRAKKLLSKLQRGTEKLKELEDPFQTSGTVNAGGVRLSSERMKVNFRNYLVRGEPFEEVAKKSRALSLETNLSEFFAPKQKELLRKRLERRPFTKTEREYFYRVVKKKLRALADEDLHQLARQMVEK